MRGSAPGGHVPGPLAQGAAAGVEGLALAKAHTVPVQRAGYAQCDHFVSSSQSFKVKEPESCAVGLNDS